MVRTMWRRKPSPLTRMTSGRSNPPPSSTSRVRMVRSVVATFAPAPWNPAKSCGADERPGRRAHRLDVERLRHVPDVARQEHRHQRRVHDPVLVGLGARAESGVKGLVHRFDRQHPHVDRQHRVQRPGQRRLGDVAGQRHARDLSERVHAGVGAPGAVHGHRSALDRRQRVLEHPLDRDAVRLALPADVVGAVVLEGELQRAGHGLTCYVPRATCGRAPRATCCVCARATCHVPRATCDG